MSAIGAPRVKLTYFLPIHFISLNRMHTAIPSVAFLLTTETDDNLCHFIEITLK